MNVIDVTVRQSNRQETHWLGRSMSKVTLESGIIAKGYRNEVCARSRGKDAEAPLRKLVLKPDRDLTRFARMLLCGSECGVMQGGVCNRRGTNNVMVLLKI